MADKVKISDSTNTTSSVIAASCTAVKAAMDKANSCLPLTGGSITGTLKFPIGYITTQTTSEFNEINLSAQAESSYGACILLYNYYALNEANRGKIRLITANGASSYGPILELLSNGTCTWNQSEVFLPAGAVFAFAGNINVPGCLICNGATISRTTYARLFNAIGTTYGAGNGSTTFNLPTIDGRFIEGSAIAGTYINAGLPNITGSISSIAGFGYGGEDGGAMYKGGDLYGGNLNTDEPQFNSLYFEASRANVTYGASTTVQPPALTMRYFIKY